MWDAPIVEGTNMTLYTNSAERIEAANQLEALVDKFSLSDVLLMLSDIAAEKAEHIRSNWQDSTTARNWDKAADVVAKAHHSVIWC